MIGARGYMKQKGQYILWESCYIFYHTDKVVFCDKVTFEQKPDERERISYVNVWGTSILSRRNSKCKDQSWEHVYECIQDNKEDNTYVWSWVTNTSDGSLNHRGCQG